MDIELFVIIGYAVISLTWSMVIYGTLKAVARRSRERNRDTRAEPYGTSFVTNVISASVGVLWPVTFPLIIATFVIAIIKEKRRAARE